MGNVKSSLIYGAIHASKRKSFNQLGMSLVEVLVALGLVGILSMVLAAVIQNMHKSQKQIAVSTTLNSMKQNIEKIILDGDAWSETIANPDVDATGNPGVSGADPLNRAIANLSCITLRTACPHSNPPAPGAGLSYATESNAYFNDAAFIDMPVLSNSSGARYINSSVGTAGFTEQGAECNTFVAPPGVGNDSCPIRWEIKLLYSCPGAVATCVDPGIRAFGILHYNPNPNNPMRSIVNPAKYRVDIARGPRGNNRAEDLKPGAEEHYQERVEAPALPEAG